MAGVRRVWRAWVAVAALPLSPHDRVGSTRAPWRRPPLPGDPVSQGHLWLVMATTTSGPVCQVRAAWCADTLCQMHPVHIHTPCSIRMPHMA